MRTIIDRKLPAPKRAQFIVDSARKGHTARRITVDIAGHNRVDVRATVDRVLADVDSYDTFVDDVAVDRAYQGDRAVWVALTRLERRAVVDRVTGRALAGKDHMNWPGLRAADAGCELGWVGLWAEAVGEHPRRMVALVASRRGALKERAT